MSDTEKADEPSETKKEIDFIKGDNSILLIAPHGVMGDDDNTNILTREIQKELKCAAIINEHIPRKGKGAKDLNLIKDAETCVKFISSIKKVINAEGPTLVLWIHGIKNENIKKEAGEKESNYTGKPEDLHALIGYGQGPNPMIPESNRKGADAQDSFTAKVETCEKLRDFLTSKGLTTIFTRYNAPKYRGRDPENMNQWFLTKEPDLEKVQSIQLEIRKKGFRDNVEHIKKTAEIIEEALRMAGYPEIEIPGADAKQADEKSPAQPTPYLPMVIPSAVENAIAENTGEVHPVKDEEKQPVEPVQGIVKRVKKDKTEVEAETEVNEELVKKASIWLAGRIKAHYVDFMLEAGQYLIEHFYGDDYEKAERKTKKKNKSLNALAKELGKTGNAPSKTWIYNAVDFAVDHWRYSGISAYGNLGLSHKVALTHCPVEKKEEIINEAVEKKYTVAQLKNRISELKDVEPGLRLDDLPPRVELLKCDIATLKRFLHEAQSRVDFHKAQLETFKNSKKKLSAIVDEKEHLQEDKAGGKGRITGFGEWAVSKHRVNICKGCSNDCLYCFNKEPLFRRNQIERGHWKDEVIKTKLVNAPRKLRIGRVPFPTTHDITLKNIDAYITVLGKLLRAGNEILITSKPKPECIKRVCDTAAFFKDRIIFRFTIGAMDNAILSFWEPNAPTYEERKQALKIAFEAGYTTSVSMEPMLDSPNIKAVVDDLLPFVNDAIWIGTLNYPKEILKANSEEPDSTTEKINELKARIEVVEANQTPEKIMDIYAMFKDNPKIKWKAEIKDIVGIDRSVAAGMDQ